MPSLADRFRAFFRPQTFAISPDLRDGPHWRSVNSAATTFDPDPETSYLNALEAWQKNPYAKRIIDLITDYCIGDGLTPQAAGDVGRFVSRFWEHPENVMPLRLPDLVDELSRAGDLFIVLFRNPADGMSYVRTIPKPEIQEIVTSERDWEKEIGFFQRPPLPGGEPIFWHSPHHPDAAAAEAVMIHYSINRVIGLPFGNSELQTIVPWLQRYSRMLEDRVRLNWAVRAFLWFVKVPTSQVQAKAEQYGAPPEPGSIIVHDDGETWDLKTPSLGGNDAQHDLRALRQMISAGSGQPPHWHGDGGDVNRATAAAMNDPAVRHLRRRQKHLQYLLIDLCATAYKRAYEIGRTRTAPKPDLITIELPDISREDNGELASAAGQLATAFSTLLQTTQHPSPTLRHRLLTLVFRFAGEHLTPEELDKIDAELAASAAKPQHNDEQSLPA